MPDFPFTGMPSLPSAGKTIPPPAWPVKENFRSANQIFVRNRPLPVADDGRGNVNEPTEPAEASRDIFGQPGSVRFFRSAFARPGAVCYNKIYEKETGNRLNTDMKLLKECCPGETCPVSQPCRSGRKRQKKRTTVPAEDALYPREEHPTKQVRK